MFNFEKLLIEIDDFGWYQKYSIILLQETIHKLHKHASF